MKEDPIIWSNGRVQIKKKKINEDPSFRSNGRALKKEMKEDTIIKSNGRVQIKKINQ